MSATRSRSTLPATGEAGSAFQARHWSRWSRSSHARTSCSSPSPVACPRPVEEVLVDGRRDEPAAREVLAEVRVAGLARRAHGVVAVDHQDEREGPLALRHPDPRVERQRIRPEPPQQLACLVGQAAERVDRAARVDGRCPEQRTLAVRGTTVRPGTVGERRHGERSGRPRILEASRAWSTPRRTRDPRRRGGPWARAPVRSRSPTHAIATAARVPPSATTRRGSVGVPGRPRRAVRARPTPAPAKPANQSHGASAPSGATNPPIPTGTTT